MERQINMLKLVDKQLELSGEDERSYNRSIIAEVCKELQQNFCKPDVSGCKELLLQMIEREQKYIDKCRSEGKGHEHSKGIIKGLEIAINVEENYHRLIAI